MWLMTPRGFYSVVAHRDDADVVLVRARDRGDLESLAELSPGLAVAHTPERDYAWRVLMDRAEWARVVGRLAAEIDYPNFKSKVAAAQGHERASVYSRVWSTLRSLQARE